MNPDWFRDLPGNWDPELAWNDDELDRATELLAQICAANRGEVLPDEQIDEEDIRRHCLDRLRMTLGTLATRYANALWPTADIQLYAEPSKAFDVSLPFVTPSRFRMKVDLNTASFAELEALPGIGDEKARAIIEYRRKHGRFRRVADVEKVHGIGEKGAQDLHRYARVVDPRRAPVRVNSAALAQFRQGPTFEKYVQLLNRGEFSVSPYAVQSRLEVKERIFRELEGLATQSPTRLRDPFRNLRGMLASEVRQQGELRTRVAQIEARRCDDADQGVLVPDWRYPVFLKELIANATGSIRIIMFFMRFEDEDAYPTDEVFAELGAAKARGVDIKVILDRSAQDAPVQSEIINEEAFAFFEDHGISVRWDSVDRKTHTKLVVADDRHVLVGSHNWTAGSFFLYDDTSIYLHSPKLGEHYAAQFESLWTEYADDDG